jgi:hypothetical protein
MIDIAKMPRSSLSSFRRASSSERFRVLVMTDQMSDDLGVGLGLEVMTVGMSRSSASDNFR